MTNQIAGQLRAARQLILDPANHIKHHDAITEDGQRVDPKSPHARKFCILGAVYRIIPEGTNKNVLYYFDLAMQELHGWPTNHKSLIRYNYSMSHEQVLELFLKASEIAERLENETQRTRCVNRS